MQTSMHRWSLFLVCTVGVCVANFQRTIFYDPPQSVRPTATSAAADDSFAAREARRYLLVTTGGWSTISDDQRAFEGFFNRSDAGREALVIASPASPLVDAALLLLGDADRARLLASVAQMRRQAATATTKNVGGAHAIHRFDIHDNIDASGTDPRGEPNGSLVLLLGADEVARQYAVYSLTERVLGVRFELHGDVLPDPSDEAGGLPLRRCATSPLPMAAFATGGATAPVFDYRGLQPFHDFPEGPDWWDTGYYKHVMTQISKMKMNFLGLHTYPYAKGTPTTAHDEPTVWVGIKEWLAENGSVTTAGAYATSYANTMRGEWGYASLATSNYSWGSDALFETDCWASGPSGRAEACPAPAVPAAQLRVFEETADMLEAAFAHGHRTGVQSCVGTETPLSAPAPGTGPGWDCRPSKELGCFQDAPARVLPHTVTIHDDANSQEWCAAQCALANYTVAAVEYGVACVCGNTVPPPSAALDRSRCAAMKCAANATEDCGGSYVLLAYSFACHGPRPPPGPTTQDYYEGIFTRLSKRVPSLDWFWTWTPEAWEWGHMDAKDPTFTKAVDDLAAAMAAKQATRFAPKMATNGWVVGPLPDRSIFDKVLPTTWDAITSIDLNTGHDPVDPAYKNVTRHAKWAIPWMEDDPDMTAPQLWVNRTLEHMEDAATYGCSGLLGIMWRTRATGPQIAAMAQKSWNAGLTSRDFWSDWTEAQFGTHAAPNATAAIAAVFEAIDSFAMPTVVSWSGGPGKMAAGCSNAQKDFSFVDTLAQLRSGVAGAANLARFDYWVNSFQYMRGIAHTECAWDGFNTAMKAVSAGGSPAQQKELATKLGLPARTALIRNATVMMTALQRTLSNPGELGTYMNIESHSLLGALNDQGLAKYLGLAQLPPDATTPRSFVGDEGVRLIVPTVRSTAERNETGGFVWRALVLGQGCTGVTLHTRSLGGRMGDAFKPVAIPNLGRAVYQLPLGIEQLPETDFEWYATADGCGAVFPAGAPTVTQTVVWMD